MFGIIHATIDRANRCTLWFVVKTDALSAFLVGNKVHIHIARVLFHACINRSNGWVIPLTLEACSIGKLPFCAALVYGVIRTLGFACTAIDAFICNHYGHDVTVVSGCNVKFGAKIRTHMTNTFKSGLVQLGQWFRGELPGRGGDDADLLSTAEGQNRWFTSDFVRMALHANGTMLDPLTLDRWTGEYPELSMERKPQRIGLVLAGNLPMVGWHDILCVLMSGHCAVIKCSSSDGILIPAAIEALQGFVGKLDLVDRVEFVSGQLGSLDAVIATGSANSNRYFEYYFRALPKVLRSQRTSAAVLLGTETDDELRALGADVFNYYGMGCRSVTKLFLPTGFDLDRLFAVWVDWAHLANNNKYANNYDYHKAVWLLNQYQLIENGFVLLKQDDGWFSPVGTLYYDFYDDLSDVSQAIEQHADSIQCVATSDRHALGMLASPIVALGQTQCPAPWEYADGIDTLSFLLALSSSPVAR